MHNEHVKQILVSPQTSLNQAMKALDDAVMETILVIDDQEKLIGLVTDGDIRRAILSGIGLDEKIEKVMNRNFTTVHYQMPTKDIIKIMKKHYFKQMPLVDNERRVVDIILLKDVISPSKFKDNLVVLMAGGMGNRLRPLTNEIPKPMLKIGEKPILEIIINQFKNAGFKNFVISINYLADIVEGYFGDGSDFDINVQYIRETKRLGTAGCLKLIENKIDKPFFVMNGDLLTKIDFNDMYHFHLANSFDVTIGIRKYDYQIPYGVIRLDGNAVSTLVEKPTDSCTINAGVYCLNPQVIECIPQNEYYDITTLIDLQLQSKGKVGGYHITDYWMDIGKIDDYNKANADYQCFLSSILPYQK